MNGPENELTICSWEQIVLRTNSPYTITPIIFTRKSCQEGFEVWSLLSLPFGSSYFLYLECIGCYCYDWCISRIYCFIQINIIYALWKLYTSFVLICWSFGFCMMTLSLAPPKQNCFKILSDMQARMANEMLQFCCNAAWSLVNNQ